MNKYKNLEILMLLIFSLIVIVNTLFTASPIQIISETGEKVTSTGSIYFGMLQTIMLVMFSLISGMAIAYLYREISLEEMKSIFYKEGDDKKIAIGKINVALNILSGDEKEVFSKVVENKEGIKQNELCLKTGMSKVKMTRILKRLESKSLISRSRYGLTNLIKVRSI